MPAHVEFEQWVPFPLEQVFAFFSDPRNLPRIMPPAGATQLLVLNRIAPSNPPQDGSGDEAAGVGTTMVTSFRVVPFLPIRRWWTARITEFGWNRHFADVQEQGPFKTWHHRHEFLSEQRNGVAGTLIRDVIDYEIGFGFLGAIADVLFVRRQLQNTFAERQKRLTELLG